MIAEPHHQSAFHGMFLPEVLMIRSHRLQYGGQHR
jgi:hypothetical protein